jgi:hypothetical protein
MLEQLWNSLKPGVRRTGGRHTKEWGEIGFQGQDPMTDFRCECYFINIYIYINGGLAIYFDIYI